MALLQHCKMQFYYINVFRVILISSWIVFLFQLEESEARYAESQKSLKSLSTELENLHMEIDNLSRNKNMVIPILISFFFF